MDIAFTREEQAFREEVRQFFRDNDPAEMRRKMVEGRHLSTDEMIARWRILNKNGWGVSHSPKQYGGTWWTSVQHYHFNEDLQSCPAPYFGVSMVAPSSTPSARRSRRSGRSRRSRRSSICRASPMSTAGGARALLNPAPARTSPRSEPRPSESR